MQDLWRLKIGWDDDIPVELNRRAFEFFKRISIEASCSFPRSPTGSNPVNLHVFADVSTAAMGVATYLVDDYHKISFLLTSKSRVAPISKSLTIPKLELTALLFASRLAFQISRTLSVETITLWSDSKVAIAWCHKKDIKMPYVANRMKEINTFSFPVEYVPTNDNPADFLTRADPTKQCISSNLWQHWPEFLLP